MKARLSKKFQFSASHSKEDKIIGHNYRLTVVVSLESLEHESLLETTVQKLLINKIDSRDFGLHVDFLKGFEISDLNLLKAFWELLETPLQPLKLVGLSLERDRMTKVSLAND